MGKKQVVVEELESEDEFDGFSQDDSEEAPVALKKGDAKRREEKALKPIKKAPRIRGADIFAQELPASAVADLQKKQALVEKTEAQEKALQETKQAYEQRNAAVQRQALKKSTNHIIFKN